MLAPASAPPPCPLQAFGPGGLGICTVSGVPGFVEVRQALLPLAAQLAALPDAVKAALEDPASRYNFGWAHGAAAGSVVCMPSCPSACPAGVPIVPIAAGFHSCSSVHPRLPAGAMLAGGAAGGRCWRAACPTRARAGGHSCCWVVTAGECTAAPACAQVLLLPPPATQLLRQPAARHTRRRQPCSSSPLPCTGPPQRVAPRPAAGPGAGAQSAGRPCGAHGAAAGAPLRQVLRRQGRAPAAPARHPGRLALPQGWAWSGGWGWSANVSFYG